jgi:hypothetical protein
MNSTPQELFFFLLFGAVLLLQFVYKQWRRRPEGMQTPRAPQDQDWEQDLDEAAATAAPPAPAWTFTPAGASGPQWAAPAAMAARTPPLLRQRQRRFSRSGLMPDRRAVQDAIVIAAILSPCHAQRPHGLE